MKSLKTLSIYEISPLWICFQQHNAIKWFFHNSYTVPLFPSVSVMLGVVHKLRLQDEVGGPKMSTF
jgi:hypothetical protein